MTAPDEEEVASGLLPFTINGSVRYVPELKWRANREWRERLQATWAALMDIPLDTPAGQEAAADAQRALVLAYDTTGALGDLEDATERDIDTIYNRLFEVSFPLAESQMALTVAIFRAAASARESSTSLPSPSGTSVPTRSRRRSPSARSSSTTPRLATA